MLNLYRRSLNQYLLQNLNNGAREVCSVQFYCNLTPPENVLHYELGDFSKELKPYLLHKRKSRLNAYTQEIFRNEHPIIKCKNSRLNYYRGQTYEKFSPIPLASEHWRGHKSVGDFFTIKIYPDGYKGKYNNLTTEFINSDLHPHIIDVLTERGIETMSEIQELAIPEVLRGNNCLIAAETGCGKTLAYLLPIIQQVLQWRKGVDRSTNMPYVVIMTPNRELTEQIRGIVRWFRDLGIGSHKLVGGSIHKKLQNPVIGETDILVTTPIVVHKMRKAGLYSFEDVRHIVLDEADTLLDDSFSEPVVKFINDVKILASTRENDVQLTLVSATMPTSIPDILGEVIDVNQLHRITTKELHLIMPHVKQKFIRVLRSTKAAHLLRLVKTDNEKDIPTIVFCNHAETCQWVSEFLRESGVSNVNLTGSMTLTHRKGKFRQFQNGEENVLVSTNVASRGLDTRQVKHVLNYDFPLFISEYIHRCGRTGRLGSNVNGRVTNLISGKNEIPLVQKIELAVRCNIELENVNSNIKRIIKFHNASAAERKLGVA